MNPGESKISAAPVLSVSGLSHTFGEGSLARRVLHDVRVEFGGGEVAIIMGPSGSGKTTFLSLVGALRVPQVGSIKVANRELTGASNAELSAWRREIGFIFQAHNLIASLTACQNVQLPLSFDRAETSETSREKALEILRLVGLKDHADKPPGMLSGGQRQRVAIARALVGRPKLILADEPTASLDKKTGHEIADLLRELARQFNCTILVVTHDHRILDIADRIILLEDGRMEDLDAVLEKLMNRLGPIFRELLRELEARAACSAPTPEQRSIPGAKASAGIEELHQRLNDLSHFQTRAIVARRVDGLQQMAGHARLIVESLAKLIELMSCNSASEFASLADLFQQALETLLHVAAEALEQRDPVEIGLLCTVTGDRRELMVRIRENYFNSQSGLSPEGRAFLFDNTNAFTRIVASLNRIGQLLQEW